MKACSLRPRTALLLDLDDTLYDYASIEQGARTGLHMRLAAELGWSLDTVRERWDSARRAVKGRLGHRAAAHSRLLYLSELLHAAGAANRLVSLRGWERAFWTRYLDAAVLRPGAHDLLRGWRVRGRKVAIVTDLTLEVQLWKLEALGLLDDVDALVASEEVLADKPAPEIFQLAAARLCVGIDECVVVGDSPSRDGGGAEALGLPYFQSRSSEHPERGGLTLSEIAEALERLS